MNDVYGRVRQVIRKQIHDPTRTLPTNTHFHDHLHFDSLEAMELVLNLEEEFDIEIPDEEADRLNTVGDLVAFVEKQLNPPGGKHGTA